jgi:TIGR03009 family protein
MTTRISFWAAVGLWMAVGQALGQTSPDQQGAASNQPAQQSAAPSNGASPYGSNAGRQDEARRQDGVGQNVVPQGPATQPRAPQQPPAPPFVLTIEQQQQLDAVLQAWEQTNKNVKTFECTFTRFEYNLLWGNANQPRLDKGEIKYAAPDKGMYRVDVPRPEHWICDGQSIFEYSFQKKELIEYKLPPELRGKAISDGPLPFLFGADAQKLKQRYYLRVTAQSATEIRLEAYPMSQQAAANMHHAELILHAMQPYALKIHSPNGKDSTVYVFEGIRINETKPLAPLRFFENNPFHATTPRGWQKIVEPGAAQAASRPPQMSNQPLVPRR